MKYYGGIDLGGTNTKIGLINEKGILIFKTNIKTNSNEGYEATVKRICDVLKREIYKAKIDIKDLISVGIGIPGPVINKKVVKFFANFPWPNNLDLAKVFEKELNVSVYLDNDVNVITLGEVWGRRSEYRGSNIW